MTSADRLVELLAGLPEARLEILELAWRLVGPDGQLDHDRAAMLNLEVQHAVDEARTYARAADRLRGRLARLAEEAAP